MPQPKRGSGSAIRISSSIASRSRVALGAPALDQVALRVGKNDVAHGLVIFDVPGAAAQMAVERLGNGVFEIAARHRLFRQSLQQHLTLVEKSGGAIAALE